MVAAVQKYVSNVETMDTLKLYHFCAYANIYNHLIIYVYSYTIGYLCIHRLQMHVRQNIYVQTRMHLSFFLKILSHTNAEQYMAPLH